MKLKKYKYYAISELIIGEIKWKLQTLMLSPLRNPQCTNLLFLACSANSEIVLKVLEFTCTDSAFSEYTNLTLQSFFDSVIEAFILIFL